MGSTFTIHLPLIKGAAQPAVMRQATFPRGTEQLLLVDDEECIVDLERQILEKLGYGIDSSCSSLEALKIFKIDPQRFDLVLTDLTMPNMTGEKLAAEIHRIRPGIPVILMSGYASRLSQQEAQALGIEAVLMKPVNGLTLAKTIRSVLDGD